MESALLVELFERVKTLEIRVAELEMEKSMEEKNTCKSSKKYKNLMKYLVESGKSSIKLTFNMIEDILGETLPASARRYREFWANTDRPISNAWQSAGYVVVGVNMLEETIVLEKA